MAKTLVLLDIDNCVLNWTAGLEQFIEQHQPHITTADTFDEHAYDLSDRYGLDSSHINQLIWDFHTHSSFADLEPLPGAVSAINQLFDRFCLIAITACGSYPLTQQMRKQNLHRLFPHMFATIHCTDSFEQKRLYLKQYPPGFWVEDHISNALMGLDYGHCCFLIDHPYNREFQHESVTRVRSLLDAAEIMLAQSHSNCQ